jgi:hypothetical protein
MKKDMPSFHSQKLQEHFIQVFLSIYSKILIVLVRTLYKQTTIVVWPTFR